MRRTVRALAGLVAAATAMTFAACGSSNTADTSTTAPAAADRSAAITLQEAMGAAARAIDEVRGTRTSLERLGTSLQPAIAQTSDAIGVLTPRTGDTDRLLLTAAREQRTFLQFAHDATDASGRAGALSALTRAAAAGRRATESYAAVAAAAPSLAGLLPSATAFNTGRLRDAVRAAYRTGTTTKPSTSGGSTSSSGTDSTGQGGSTSCGDGITVNSVTSCSFAQNVAQAYRDSGGASVVDAYSPKTGTVYTMTCTDEGILTVCRGGNGAVVSIR